MATRKKKELFEVDLSVFDGIQQPDAIEKSTPRERRIHRKEVSLQDALETLQRLGFKVTPPTSQEDEIKYDISQEKLGVKNKKTSKTSIPDHRLYGTLVFSHTVGGSVYGPGNIALLATQKDLYQALLKQDQLCMQHYNDSSGTRESRCFVIQEGLRNGQNRYKKQEVQPSVFHNGLFPEAVITGPQDAPGAPYIPYPTRMF